MNRWTRLAVALAAIVMLWSGLALAQAKPACDPAKTPAMVSGVVVSIDHSQDRVTIRASDGTTHQFQASKETLNGLKAGDQLDAKLRSAPKC
jgi:hypothetical protein